MSGFRRLDPEEWEAFVLASDTGGWVTREQGERLRDAAGAVAALEARHRDLESELAAAVEAGFRRGLQAAEAQIAELVAEVAAERSRMVTRAARAALEVAEAFVGQRMAQDPELAAAAIGAAVSEPAGRAPTRLLVSPHAVAAVERALDHRVPVAADNRLSIGDAVIEYGDGKVDRRLASVLAGWSADVTAYIAGADDD